MRPLVFDLFCGLGGWTEAFIAEGYRAVGFDIEKHDYGTGGYPGELVQCDVRSISGAELVKTYGIPTCIVASPPCQEFSYMAMPWKKAKEKRRNILGDPNEKIRLTELFNQCFRIQHEISKAAGQYIPLIIENVRGAQEWVGKSRWNFGSFYLWGDVPALMPIPAKAVLKNGVTHRSNGATNWHGYDGNKSHGMNWSDRTIKGQDFTRIAGRQLLEGTKVASDVGRTTDKGNGVRFTSTDCGIEGNKGFRDFPDSLVSLLGSKSKARKRASAEIAKIPPALASWIAKIFKRDAEIERTNK